ncbi:MAG: alanine:cation symporter family protein [Candidatus Methanomethylophilaceae archaeon]|nr:alanine:cation symporter family protein [Candidatus Methanomethylophilaceae archaeon]
MSFDFDSFIDAVWEFDDVFWFIPLVLIVAFGLYATVKFGAVQFVWLKEMFRVTFSLEKDAKNKITPFHVFCVSMGNRIGIGNIAGPITAIALGGPGAIFWMWIFATLGGATSFVETTVGQIFKGRDENGDFIGGPAYNVAKGLNAKKFGMAIAVLMIAVYIGGFVLSEIVTISSSFSAAYDFEKNTLVIAFILAVIAVLVAIGGFRGVANVSVLIVPFMAFAWIVLSIVVIALNIDGVTDAIGAIFTCAFNVPSAVGGGLGSMIVWALRRGVWSNEAGEGTITNISSSADVPHPVKQGLSQSIGVLFDTIISTMTALVILTFFHGNYDDIVGKYDSFGESAQALMQHVMEASIGDIAPTLVFFFMFLFAITCFMGDYVIGMNNLKFITQDKKAKAGLMIITVLIVFFSAYYGSEGLYAIMDVILGVAGIVNCFVMFKLSKYAYEAFQDYRKQKAEGIKEPVFHKSALSDPSGVTEWDD